MKQQHTPGPWHVSTPPPNGEQIIGNEKGMMVAVATTGVGLDNNTTTTLANARLIAAAPDLLEALCDLFDTGDVFMTAIEAKDAFSCDFYKWRDKAKLAISKATGE